MNQRRCHRPFLSNYYECTGTLRLQTCAMRRLNAAATTGLSTKATRNGSLPRTISTAKGTAANPHPKPFSIVLGQPYETAAALKYRTRALPQRQKSVLTLLHLPTLLGVWGGAPSVRCPGSGGEAPSVSAPLRPHPLRRYTGSMVILCVATQPANILPARQWKSINAFGPNRANLESVDALFEKKRESQSSNQTSLEGPVTCTTVPLTNLAASEHRNAATSPASSGRGAARPR